MAITDEKQRIMPMPEDLLPGRGKPLIVPESVLLINPINPDLKGEVFFNSNWSLKFRMVFIMVTKRICVR